MGCGCNKTKMVPTLPGGASNPLQAAPKSYDVLDGGGAVVASTTNLVFARVEARRVGGTVVPSTATSASPA